MEPEEYAPALSVPLPAELQRDAELAFPLYQPVLSAGHRKSPLATTVSRAQPRIVEPSHKWLYYAAQACHPPEET